MQTYKYDAFISYRHTEPDKAIAEKLHRMLETYKVPKAVIKMGSQKKVGRVFRDREELPTSSPGKLGTSHSYLFAKDAPLPMGLQGDRNIFGTSWARQDPCPADRRRTRGIFSRAALFREKMYSSQRRNGN